MPPRRSLTKTQLQTPVGLELLTLLLSITEDGKIGESELADLRAWLAQNANSGLPSQRMLSDTVARIIADGVVTEAEVVELQVAIEAALPPDFRWRASEARKEAAETKWRAEDEALAQSTGAAASMEEADVERRPHLDVARAGRAVSSVDEPLATYDFMVAGVAYEGRTETVRSLYFADDSDLPVVLVRDLTNKHSKHAVAVRLLRDGRILGYVPEWSPDVKAREVAQLLDRGAKQRGWIKKMWQGKRAPGVVVVVELWDSSSTADGVVVTPIPIRPSSGAGCLVALVALAAVIALMALIGKLS